ncbi:MAG: hypothetical protein JNM78_07160 [Cyclobacteriaceae bacterium]|nr:hypothetical protein [Cyclobacteriaceae bacterium]
MKIKNENIIAGVFALIIIVIWMWFYFYDQKNLNDLEVLFVALSFLGVIWAVVVQKQELELQRKELEDTRIVFKEQSETIKKQRFENSFFQLLNVHIERQRLLTFDSKFGDESFYVLIKNLDIKKETNSLLRNQKYESYEQNIKLAFEEMRKDPSYISFITHFKNTFVILKYIKKSSLIEETEKSFYFDILKTQHSQSELYLLKLESEYVDDFPHLDYFDFFAEARHPSIPKTPPPSFSTHR